MNTKTYDTQRKRFLSIRLNSQERHALDVLSIREGLPLSDLARTILREGMEARGVKTLGLLDLLYQEGAQNADQPK